MTRRKALTNNPLYIVMHEGVGQDALIDPPNSGQAADLQGAILTSEELSLQFPFRKRPMNPSSNAVRRPHSGSMTRSAVARSWDQEARIGARGSRRKRRAAYRLSSFAEQQGITEQSFYVLAETTPAAGGSPICAGGTRSSASSHSGGAKLWNWC